ncbi:hypothetical protein UlMin_030489 [Ulmus minor]
MAFTTLSQLYVTAPILSDCSLRKSSPLKTSNVSFYFEKRAAAFALKSNTKNIGSGRRVDRKIVCAVPRQGLALARKSAVSPIELEEALRPPTNLYTDAAPHTVTVLKVEKITGSNALGETYHVVFDHRGFLPHWEGQVFGVMPPPDNPFEPGDATKLSYFSAASTRYGEFFDGRTTDLCVRLVPGTTSEIICNSKPGDKFQVTGPTREAMLLGDYSPNVKHIFVATGTGVAPARANIRRFFKEDIPNFEYSGLAWLFLGVANQDSLLYDREFKQYLSDYPENFRYDYALSREETNKSGGKKYVQDTFKDHADEVFDLLQIGAYIYLSGRKEMVEPIKDVLKDVAEKEGLKWEEVFANWKRKSQWRVEVY